MAEAPTVVVSDGRRGQLCYFTGHVTASRRQRETQISSRSQHHVATNGTVVIGRPLATA